jgi:iron complex transport system substrate-binding protein
MPDLLTSPARVPGPALPVDEQDRRWAEIVAALSRRRMLAGAAGLTALGLTAACGDDAAPTTGKPATRVVQGARGPVDVPVEPKRVAALVGSNDIDVMALGITPVYAGTFAKGWTEIPAGTVAADAVPPNVETVASTRPDLLLGWNWLVDEPAWAKLVALAPGVPLPEDKGWKETFLLLADAVNRKGQGEQVLAEYEKRVTAIKGRFAARSAVKLAHVGFYKPGTMTWYGQDRDTTEIMKSVGIDVDGPATTARDVSTERLGDLTAPWLIVYGSGETGPTALSEAKKTPLWASLPAVKADQVIEVKDGVWTGAGLLWARALLDDLEKRFLA